MLFRKNVNRFLRSFEKDFETHNRIEISKSAILHNVELFANATGKDIIPVLKGNAYGHGIQQVACALKGQQFSYIAVDGYFESLRIREVAHQPVLVMSAVLPENFDSLTYDDYAFVVSDEATIRAIGKTGKRVKLHLECNTGMNRYGATYDEVIRLAKLTQEFSNLQLEGVMSHLADSDGKDQSTVDAAVRQFDACVEAIIEAGVNPTILHIAQSAGSFKAHSKYANTIRLGIGMYGINPFPRNHRLYAQLSDLQPALKLLSTITKVIQLKKGDKVSYNYTFMAKLDMTIGILPLGYYEGLHRSLSNVGMVKIGSQFAPIIGRVCMNHTMVNLDGIKANVGDEVTVYSNNTGDKNAIDTIAHEYGLFNYNLLTALSPDIRRVLVD